MAEPTQVGIHSLDRPGLHQRLDYACRRRICTVFGAAGWGKSTAVASWSRNRPTAWVSCEHLDGGAPRFVQALRDALDGYLPDGPSASVPSGGPCGLKTALAAVHGICSQLRGSRGDELFLVLDDLQVARPGSNVARLVETLARDGPEHLHLVLISRRELPFSLARPRGQGLVAEIDARDLAFDAAEIRTLLPASTGPGPGCLAERVWERTGGWPAAVLGAVELIRGCGPEGPSVALDRLSRPGERFHGYLSEEVLAALRPPVVGLMRGLAVRGEVAATDLIAPGIDGAPAALIELTRQGLVRCSPRDPTVRSLVPPLADYFESDPTLTADERAVLRIGAAHDRAARQDHASALRCLIAAGADAEAAALLVEHGAALNGRGDADAVLDAARLPTRYLDDPRVQRVLGHALQVRGRWPEATDRLRDADRGGVLDPALAWCLGTLAFGQGDIPEVLDVCQRARRPDVAAGTAEDVRVAALAATALRLNGRLQAARAEIARVEAAGRAGEPRVRACIGQVRALSRPPTGTG